MSTETATHITWNDQIGKRGRRPWLLLIKDDVIHSFEGDSIPGIVAVVGYDYQPNGKWSNTTFRLALAPGVRAISGLNGWNTATFRVWRNHVKEEEGNGTQESVVPEGPTGES